MFERTRLPDGAPAVIIVGHNTEDRLRRTCFRGRDLAASGNFSRWEGPLDVFDDPSVRLPFLEDVLEATEEAGAGRTDFSVNVEAAEEVGWSSTADRAGYPDDVLEPFEPNRRSRALRVRTDRPDLRAPRTRLVTLIYTLGFEEERGWVVVVRSMYPGPDIGELDGDITAREGCVFFDWSHPGEE